MSFIFIFFCIFLKLDGPERRLLRSISFISTSCFIHLTISSWAPEHWNVDNALDSRSLVSRCTRQSGPRVVSFGWSSRVPPPNGKLRPSDGYVTSDCLFVQGSARSSFFFLLLTSRQRFNCAEGGPRRWLEISRFLLSKEEKEEASRIGICFRSWATIIKRSRCRQSSPAHNFSRTHLSERKKMLPGREVMCTFFKLCTTIRRKLVSVRHCLNSRHLVFLP